MLAIPGAASARTEVVRWTYSAAASVTGFRVHVGTASGTYASTLEVGKPAPAGGVYSATISVGDSQVVYAAVSAYSATQSSPTSNERRLDPPPVVPPPPNPPPPNPPPPNPPPGNAQWSTQFEDGNAGDDPAGWVDTRASNSLATDDSIFEIMNVSGNKAFGTASTATNVHSHYVTTASRTWSSYEFRGRMRISDKNGGIGVNLLSQYPQRDAYYRMRRNKGANVEFVEMSPHPFPSKVIACSAKSTGVKPAANTWYRFRFQASDESTRTVLRGKVWVDGAAEPSAWQMDCADDAANRLRAGVPGVWSMGPGLKYWDDLEVAPLGSAPPGEQPSNVPASPILLD